MASKNKKNAYKPYQPKQTARLTYCAVDQNPCSGICAKLHKEDTTTDPVTLCTELMQAPRKKKHKKKKIFRRVNKDDDE